MRDSAREVSRIIIRSLRCVFIEYYPEPVQSIFPYISSLYYTSWCVLTPRYTVAVHVAIAKQYNKFWEELIACFPFTVILVFHTSRKKTVLCIRNEVNETAQYGRLQCWYY
jgi:hypothetical protein